MRFLNIIFVIVFSVTLSSHAQDTSEATAKKVANLLDKSQNVYTKHANYSVTTNYKSYGAHNDTEVLQEYNGYMLKQGNTNYLGISNTAFLSTGQHMLKVYGNEKVIEYLDQPDNTILNKSPLQLQQLLKYYKYKDITDNGTHYICTLQTSYITQMPYGKIVIHINKKDYTITKQILYLLTRLPYISPKTGEKKMGNPKVEITLSNFKTKLTKEDRALLQLSTYLNINGAKVSASTAYKDFKIESVK